MNKEAIEQVTYLSQVPHDAEGDDGVESYARGVVT